MGDDWLTMDLMVAGAAALGLTVDERQASAFARYYGELVAWNERLNLTAIAGLEEVQRRHFLDSLTVATVLPSPAPAGLRLMDLGSGAGFPGIPLKLLLPQLRVTLLEATGKKARFLEHVVSVLELDDVEVLCARAENAARLPEQREAYQVVTARAVAPLPVLAELALPLCSVGGIMISLKKGDISQELERAARAARILGASAPVTTPVSVPGLESDGRCLVSILKRAPTPERFPRRAGIPGKRPLG